VKNIISLSEIVGEIERPEGPCELCASADGAYDEASARLNVKLDCFLRPSGTAEGTTIPVDWLPHPETVTESVSRPEASAMSKDIFSAWVRRVRKAVR
jgi:hypothetical protein